MTPKTQLMKIVINFITDITSYAKIRVDVFDWFATITKVELIAATLTDIDGIDTIFISENVNETIYNTVLNRIGQVEVLEFE